MQHKPTPIHSNAMHNLDIYMHQDRMLFVGQMCFFLFIFCIYDAFFFSREQCFFSCVCVCVCMRVVQIIAKSKNTRSERRSFDLPVIKFDLSIFIFQTFVD